jgi:hypothetical protein
MNLLNKLKEVQPKFLIYCGPLRIVAYWKLSKKSLDSKKEKWQIECKNRYEIVRIDELGDIPHTKDSISVLEAYKKAKRFNKLPEFTFTYEKIRIEQIY